MNLAAAQFFLGQSLPGTRHHRRARYEHVRNALDHQRVMAAHQPSRAEPRDRAKAERHDRHSAHVGDDPIPRRIGWHISVAHRLDGLDRTASAGAVDQADEGHAQLVRHLLGHHLLAADRGIGRTAAHGEIVTADHDRPALDPPAPEHEIGGPERLKLAIVAVLRASGECADLVKAAGIEQLLDPLAHREPPGIVLALDLVRPAHLARQGLTAAQFLDIGFPAHASTPGRRDYSIGQGKRGQGAMAEVTVRSELNAIVWKVEVAVGATVGAGDTLIILEAMKMEIPVAAPRAGTVKSLLVEEKQQVGEGQPLAILQF
jgi:biotin carboxyl carrier protein